MESKYIKTYDNVLTKEQCQHIIDKFEDSKQQWQKTELENHRSFTEINLNLNDDWSEYVNIIYNSLRPFIDKYAEEFKITHNWPEKFGWEQIRMKKYEVNNREPEAGKLLMFPPLWTHKHAGTMPIKEPKYIIGSYLHYV